jgi:long-chain fatty acid transport protein
MKRQRLIIRAIPALIATAFSGYAAAAGFALLEQNASGIGNAYAGSAAVADNASTIFFNPAGMTQLQAREFSVGLSMVKTSNEFTDNGSIPLALAGTGNGGDAGGWGFIPNGYLSWALNPDLYIGVGFGAPFGLKTEYDAPWIGAAQAISFDVKTYNINPSIAYRINPMVSIGAGFSWQRLEAEYIRRVAVVPVPVAPGVTVPAGVAASTNVTLDADGDAWGWNLGALFTLSPSTKVGVSYRSTISHEIDGSLSVDAPLSAASSGARAEIKLPDMFILSATQQIDQRWELLGDVSWTGWSSIPNVQIVRTSGAASGTIAQTLDTDFQDTWRIALGANYKLDDMWKLRFGLAWDETPVKGASTRLVSLPDEDRYWFTFGAQYVPVKNNRLDFGMAYLYVQDADIDNNQLLTGRGLVKGTYENSVWIFGAQYSMSF